MAPAPSTISRRTSRRRGTSRRCAPPGFEPGGITAHADFSVEGGRQAIAELLALHQTPPSGVICSSDVMAIGAVNEAVRRGVKVPDPALGHHNRPVPLPPRLRIAEFELASKRREGLVRTYAIQH